MGGKPLRWSPHALENLKDREIARPIADLTLAEPEFVISEQAPRVVYMRRYFDTLLEQEMLLRVVVEETDDALVVVTVYKTSQIARYLRGLLP